MYCLAAKHAASHILSINTLVISIKYVCYNNRFYIIEFTISFSLPHGNRLNFWRERYTEQSFIPDLNTKYFVHNNKMNVLHNVK